MTYKELLEKSITDADLNKDDIKKAIALAYYAGREDATKEVSDKYTVFFLNQLKNAKKCRYYKMVLAVIGKLNIYNSDYRGDISKTFLNDNVPNNMNDVFLYHSQL